MRVQRNSLVGTHEVKGTEYELWYSSDGTWWLESGGVPLDESQLTEEELQGIAVHVDEWKTPD